MSSDAVVCCRAKKLEGQAHKPSLNEIKQARLSEKQIPEAQQ